MQLSRLSNLLNIGESRSLPVLKSPKPVNISNLSLSLSSPDQLFYNSKKVQPADFNRISRLNLFQDRFNIASDYKDQQLNNLQKLIGNIAESEWQSGVRETNGKNRSPRIDLYARESNFGTGGEWCGFFVGFNYKKAGFKYTSSFASYQKARDFFMYRSFTDRSSKEHAELDQLRSQHQSEASSRQYFMLAESPNINYVQNRQNTFGHYDINSNIFSYFNLPVREGDVALFKRGHVGMVASYNQMTGTLVTYEGNTSGTGPDGRQWHGAVVRKEYDLKDPSVRAQFDGFGRAALSDFA